MTCATGHYDQYKQFVCDDPPNPVPGTVRALNASVTEGSSDHVLNVSLTRDGTAAFDGVLSTIAGSATDGVDYVGLSNFAFHFADDQSSITVPITIRGDSSAEPDESLAVHVVSATNGAGIGPDGIVTITNDDFPPQAGSVSVSDASLTEGNSGTSIETFTLTRSGGTLAFDVDAATADGTATVAGADYLAYSDTIHFAAGQNTASFQVTVNGDTTAENNETFSVNLSAGTNGVTVSDALGVGTILNDDQLPGHYNGPPYNGPESLVFVPGDPQHFYMPTPWRDHATFNPQTDNYHGYSPATDLYLADGVDGNNDGLGTINNIKGQSFDISYTYFLFNYWQQTADGHFV